MARARNIKPAFFTSEQVADNCPLGRLLFIGLWTLADYKGDLEWKERSLKIQILPWDNCDLKELAINLDKSGLIRFYSDGKKIYINIPNFVRHQNPHKNEREKGSDLPAYSEVLRQVIDLNTLTINLDKSGLKPEYSQSDRADSLLLNPDSLNTEIPNQDAAAPAANAPPPENPKTKKSKSVVDKTDSAKLIERGCTEQLAQDFIKLRKAKKSPITDTALKLIATEAGKAGITFERAIEICIARTWSSFNASWNWQDDPPQQYSGSQPQQAQKQSASQQASGTGFDPMSQYLATQRNLQKQHESTED